MVRPAVILFALFFSILLPAQDTFSQQLADAAIELTKTKVIYDPKYVVIPYSGVMFPPTGAYVRMWS